MNLDKPSQLKIIRICGVVFLLSLILLRVNHQPYPITLPKFLVEIFLVLKSKINFGLAKILPEPQLSIMKSLFFGGKDNLSYDFKKQIRRVGLSHLVAVSGLHLTIVSQIISRVLDIFLITGSFNFFLNILFIIGFIIMADFSSSVIRAGIMATILLISKLCHRLYNSSYALIVAVLIMLIINPRIITNDFGFQLSVLATAGIIYLYPRFRKPQTNIFQETFFLSLSALIMVTPWVVYKTQLLSLVAPLSNLMVVPLIPMIMILGFIVAILSFIFIPLAFIFGFCLHLLLLYIIKVIEILSHWHLAEIFLPHINIIFIIAYYLILFYYLCQKRFRSQ